MSWHPADLVSDRDLLDYEQTILSQFGRESWLPKRTKALEDWLFPALKTRGFDPHRLRTRHDPEDVFGYTSAAYSDQTTAAKDTTVEDIDLAAVWATPATDVLYVGDTVPFKGVFVRMDDNQNATAAALTVAYWDGHWQTTPVTDETVSTTATALSRGGALLWTLPQDWTPRILNSSDRLYWARLSISATPTGAKASQVATIRKSELTGPATMRTLALIFQEAPTGQEGPWLEKAEHYRDEADTALARAMDLIGGEFDTDKTGQISDTEAAQTAEEAGGGPFVLERA